MKLKPILILIAAILLLSAASNLAIAKEGSLIRELSVLDVFHPPEKGDPRSMLYDEWHYFNIIDEEQNLSFITTLTLKGDINDPSKSIAFVLLSYSTPVKENLTIDLYPVTMAEWSNRTPAVRISGSYVTLTEKGYSVHVESNDAQTVFDALFKPITDPAPVFNASFKPGRSIYWLVASPRMKVTGTLTVNKGTALEKIYELKNVRGYHDHNWGYWLWQDNVGWDWGQASEKKNNLKGDDTGSYSFVFGNTTDRNHTESHRSVLEIWKNKKIIVRFEDSEMQIRRDIMVNSYPEYPFPMITVLDAVSGENKVNIVFTAERFTPIPIPLESGGYRIIWELSGSYEVSGNIDGKPVSYTTKGFLEYVA
ncbi:MAG: hypothetical protein FIB08_10635 [Candidatus Methanoperedens sp.]|nr:hypothetical protein [Candidatus Methanoperedens sp.]